MGGCWFRCSKKLQDNEDLINKQKEKETKNKDFKKIKSISNKEDRNYGSNKRDNHDDNDDSKGNRKSYHNTIEHRKKKRRPSNPSQYEPTAEFSKNSSLRSFLLEDNPKASLDNTTSNVDMDSTQQKASEDNNRNNDTLADSKINLSNSDDNKIAAEQKKNDLPKNTSSLNHIESTNNSKGARTNASNSSENNSNTVDGTFLEGTTQNRTSFPIQPPTSPNYNPNNKAEPANKLTTNSDDQLCAINEHATPPPSYEEAIAEKDKKEIIPSAPPIEKTYLGWHC